MSNDKKKGRGRPAKIKKPEHLVKSDIFPPTKVIASPNAKTSIEAFQVKVNSPNDGIVWIEYKDNNLTQLFQVPLGLPELFFKKIDKLEDIVRNEIRLNTNSLNADNLKFEELIKKNDTLTEDEKLSRCNNFKEDEEKIQKGRMLDDVRGQIIAWKTVINQLSKNNPQILDTVLNLSSMAALLGVKAILAGLHHYPEAETGRKIRKGGIKRTKETKREKEHKKTKVLFEFQKIKEEKKLSDWGAAEELSKNAFELIGEIVSAKTIMRYKKEKAVSN